MSLVPKMSRLGFGGLEVSKMLLFSIGLNEKWVLASDRRRMEIEGCLLPDVGGCAGPSFVPQCPCVMVADRLSSLGPGIWF